MVSGTNKKLKVAWICHFSNEQVRKRLPLSKLTIINGVKSLIGKKKQSYFDFAPWVTILIKELEKCSDVELHVISPHIGLTCLTYEFEHNNVFYHFYKPDIPILHITFPAKFYWQGKPRYLCNRYLVKRFLNRITPNIVNLIGAENPYYSISTLDIKKIPVFVSAQTVYSNPDREKYDKGFSQFRWDLEVEIHKKEKYFGCQSRMHRDLILRNNPHAIILNRNFIFSRIEAHSPKEKMFDFVFFAASIEDKKGAADAIEALAFVKKTKNDVLLNMSGKCAPIYKKKLVTRIDELGLSANVVFTDFFPIQQDLFNHIVKSRFALLPVKLDAISGTIVQALALRIPVVTYKTSGTPFLNKDGLTVLTADIGDYNALAHYMIQLLNSPALAKQMSENAIRVVENYFYNPNAANDLVRTYKAIISHHRNCEPIPEDLLFNPDEHPIF